MKISPDEAAKRFNDARAKLQQAKDKAVQTAKNAADASASAASTTSFAAFCVLLLGGIAAAVGGSFAVQRRLREGELVRRSAEPNPCGGGDAAFTKDLPIQCFLKRDFLFPDADENGINSL